MKNVIKNGGTWNLSTDKIYSVVVLRITVFVSVSNDVLTNNSVYAKEKSVDSV